MKCPVCKDADMLMAERQAVEIDYCPQCRGIWLDRGELEKIIDRTQEVSRQSSLLEGRPYDDDDQDDHRHLGPQGNRNRRRGFLGDIFDF